MDKRHYYRVLGVREGSGIAEIKKAYDRHMRRLALPDYADDPEYVARKKDQIRHAYSVLVGSAPASTKEEREERFERMKDAEDAGEDAISDLKRKFKKHVRHCEAETETSVELSAGLAMLKEKLNDFMGDGTSSGGKREVKAAKIFVTVIVGLSLFGSLFTACSALVMNVTESVADKIELSLSEFATPEERPAQLAEGVISDEAMERMDSIAENCHLYDFYGNLDLSTQSEFTDQIEWEPGESTMSEIWSEMTDLAFYLGIYANSDLVQYITGNPDFYWESGDYGNAQMMVLIMNPPAYEEIAGGVNLYTREVILNYAGYLRFLADVAENQTEDLIGPAPDIY